MGNQNKTTLKTTRNMQILNADVAQTVCSYTIVVFTLKMKRKCTIRVAKTKALISFAVTAKLICIFIFAYVDWWLSHEAAHVYINHDPVVILTYFMSRST